LTMHLEQHATYWEVCRQESRLAFSLRAGPMERCHALTRSIDFVLWSSTLARRSKLWCSTSPMRDDRRAKEGKKEGVIAAWQQDTVRGP
jgi:hypothetical protein